VDVRELRKAGQRHFLGPAQEITWINNSKCPMRYNKRTILLICLEVVSLAVMIPLIYWSACKLLFVPLGDAVTGSGSKISAGAVVLMVSVFDVAWIILMRLCPRDQIHVKIVLTLLVLTLSAVVVSCVWLAVGLEAGFA
jgi:hypothetical protein